MNSSTNLDSKVEAAATKLAELRSQLTALEAQEEEKRQQHRKQLVATQKDLDASGVRVPLGEVDFSDRIAAVAQRNDQMEEFKRTAADKNKACEQQQEKLDLLTKEQERLAAECCTPSQRLREIQLQLKAGKDELDALREDQQKHQAAAPNFPPQDLSVVGKRVRAGDYVATKTIKFFFLSGKLELGFDGQVPVGNFVVVTEADGKLLPDQYAEQLAALTKAYDLAWSKHKAVEQEGERQAGQGRRALDQLRDQVQAQTDRHDQLVKDREERLEKERAEQEQRRKKENAASLVKQFLHNPAGYEIVQFLEDITPGCSEGGSKSGNLVGYTTFHEVPANGITYNVINLDQMKRVFISHDNEEISRFFLDRPNRMVLHIENVSSIGWDRKSTYRQRAFIMCTVPGADLQKTKSDVNINWM